jgi:hypothetical protein
MAARSNVTEENFIDVDPWMEQQSRDNDPRGEQQQRASGSSGVKERVLKMNALIDQHDDFVASPWQSFFHSKSRGWSWWSFKCLA